MHGNTSNEWAFLDECTCDICGIMTDTLTTVVRMHDRGTLLEDKVCVHCFTIIKEA